MKQRAHRRAALRSHQHRREFDRLIAAIAVEFCHRLRDDMLARLERDRTFWRDFLSKLVVNLDQEPLTEAEQAEVIAQINAQVSGTAPPLTAHERKT